MGCYRRAAQLNARPKVDVLVDIINTCREIYHAADPAQRINGALQSGADLLARFDMVGRLTQIDEAIRGGLGHLGEGRGIHILGFDQRIVGIALIDAVVSAFNGGVDKVI